MLSLCEMVREEGGEGEGEGEGGWGEGERRGVGYLGMEVVVGLCERRPDLVCDLFLLFLLCCCFVVVVGGGGCHFLSLFRIFIMFFLQKQF